MNNITLNSDVITKVFRELLSWLSERERTVVSMRVWLDWNKETLQWIWKSFTPAITRERVRQIEETWVKKVSRIVKTTILSELHNSAIKFLKLHWWLISSKKLMNNIIKDLNISWDVNYSVLEVVLQSDENVLKSKQKLGCDIFFHLPDINKGIVENIHNEALKVLKRKKDVINKATLYEMVVANLDWNVSAVLVDSCLSLFDDIVYWEWNLVWLAKWKVLNPRTLKDKIIYVLKKEKTPMHFVEIANKSSELLWEKVNVNTIHNELIRSLEFVLIGRWIYALKEWWFTPWTVLDVIIWILEENWWPMNTEDIKKEVFKNRNVKESTIYMNLQNKNVIERVGRNYYQLKE